MKHVIILIFGAILFSGCSCRKEDTPESKPLQKFTIQGKIYSNWDTKTPLAKQSVTLTVTRGSTNTYVSQDLGTATTDDSGWFSISYTETSITGADPGGSIKSAQIHIFSQFLQIDNIPVNENINKDFFIPTHGKLEIYLQTSNPLEASHDTLFLGHFAGYTLVTDTLIKTVNGLFRTGNVPVGVYTMFYGRGWKDFHYNASINRFTQESHSVDANIEGDPVISKMTINY